ncbi:MAG: hypothetical protein WAT23_20190 [Chromatiaceae bacterium]
MDTLGTIWLWTRSFGIVLVMLTVDLLLVGGGRHHPVSFREAASWSLVWVAVSLVFAAGLWWHLTGTHGRELADERALEFVTGYLIRSPWPSTRCSCGWCCSVTSAFPWNGRSGC